MDEHSVAIIIKAIVQEQQDLIGPLAIDEANKVPGLSILPGPEINKVDGEAEIVIKNLVNQYSRLFGQTSIEVCKEAIKKVLPTISSTHIPEFLK